MALRDMDLESTSIVEHNTRCLDLIGKTWPLPLNVAQSFSAVKVTRESVFLANDVLGFYPIYYYIENNELIVSSHLLPISRLKNVVVDEIGVIQRQIGPSFANFGRRTIIKSCNRLLPGEKMEFRISPLQMVGSEYDNSLYQNIGSPSQKQLPSVAKGLWNTISNEYKSALLPWENVTIALSGGLDSRLSLGAIPSSKSINAITYGSESFYESKVAKKLADVVGATHKCYHDYSLYFPSDELMYRYSETTESVGVASWFEILENVSTQNHAPIPILFGDMCEGIPVRNIISMTNRSFRVKEFLSKDLLSKDYELTTATNDNFAEWKNSFRNYYFQNVLALVGNNQLPEHIKVGIDEDLDLTFWRISQHNLPYKELYDELFSWHVHARVFMSKQMLLCQNSFVPLNPMMSKNVLCAVSNIHPNLKLSYRLMDMMLRQIGDLKKFNSVPSSQTPFIPQSSPLFLKLLVWGARSMVDQMLIKRMMKAKDPSKRYRVVEFLNWPQIYQNKEGHKNIEMWFTPSYIINSQRVIDTFDGRQRMDAWPLENVDIVYIGGLNLELRIIHESN